MYARTRISYFTVNFHHVKNYSPYRHGMLLRLLLTPQSRCNYARKASRFAERFLLSIVQSVFVRQNS